MPLYKTAFIYGCGVILYTSGRAEIPLPPLKVEFTGPVEPDTLRSKMEALPYLQEQGNRLWRHRLVTLQLENAYSSFLQGDTSQSIAICNTLREESLLLEAKNLSTCLSFMGHYFLDIENIEAFQGLSLYLLQTNVTHPKIPMIVEQLLHRACTDPNVQNYQVDPWISQILGHTLREYHDPKQMVYHFIHLLYTAKISNYQRVRYLSLLDHKIRKEQKTYFEWIPPLLKVESSFEKGDLKETGKLLAAIPKPLKPLIPQIEAIWSQQLSAEE
ncbi:MAG: hypothetical protein OXT67_01975, partial [Zetaproteobacteria bacterium]|nr:hypothetical protein [Zetaproteobacteria bacterium]